MMVNPYDDSRLMLALQIDHSRVAGLFAAHWGNQDSAKPEPYASVVLAAHEHDIGWWEWEMKPSTLNDKGFPMDYHDGSFKYLGQLRLDFYKNAVDRVLKRDPYAALLMAMHGVALMNAGQDPEELFRNAQFAVKQAKAAGIPQVYEAKQATEARRRFSIETELRRALDKDQLQLFYQPLINLKSGEVAGFEALARWHHEERGDISPTEFIPVAEESGLILALGRWAMGKATNTLAEWDKEAGERLPLYVSVNLSAIQVDRLTET